MFIPPQCRPQRHKRDQSEKARNCALMITDFPGEFSVLVLMKKKIPSLAVFHFLQKNDVNLLGKRMNSRRTLFLINAQ